MKRPQSTISISNGNTRSCQLLVSVRDVDEAEVCLRAGVDWIDLKEPAAGSLGMPSLSTGQQVASVLADHSQRSIALGELTELLAISARFETAKALSRLFPIAKVGLSGFSSDRYWRDKLQELSQALNGRLTPVIYADWIRCSAPSPHEVVQWAGDCQSPYLLIDTYQKDGRGLLDHLSLSDLRSLLSAAAAVGTQVVLAGSLELRDVDELIELPCAALAIRGAVCSGSRQGPICPSRLVEWVGRIKNQRDRSRSQRMAMLQSE